MSSILIKEARLVTDGTIAETDLLIKDQKIEKIAPSISDPAAKEIAAQGKLLLPGCIDDQVHFREPGLTHKADIYTESRAAVAGGITSYMEMPNTKPPTLTQELLEEKYQLASRKSLANYSFFMGASNDNLSEVLKTDGSQVCGIKVFMGSSTGNMLVDDEQVLEGLFAEAHLPVAVHCEDEATIRRNLQEYKDRYGDHIPFANHPKIRSGEACFISSQKAVKLARKHDTRLHVLHISTARETDLFNNDLPLEQKRITAEACIHHLWFSDQDYADKGSAIKWNPAIKTAEDRAGIWKALLDDRIDVVATDHAPHTWQEKTDLYTSAPSGGPLVQHALVAMMEFYHQGKISLERLVEKMCHNPAILFEVKERGFLREGYYADMVLVDPENPWKVTPPTILSKCGWSPFLGTTFRSQVTHTIVSGSLVFSNGNFDESIWGKRLSFQR